MKLYYQDCGTYIAVAIESDDPEEIELQYNSFYNYGATDGELHYMCDRFAYIWTDKVRLKKYFVTSSLYKMLNDSDQLREHDPEGWAHCCKGIKDGFMPQARINAEERMSDMTRDNFASNPNLRHVPDHYAMGYNDHADAKRGGATLMAESHGEF
jgi:hypothetical protein